MNPAPSAAHRKAVILFSGGLDSILAARALLDQGIDLTAIHFDYPFMNKDIARWTRRTDGTGRGRFSPPTGWASP
ncbi:MAG: 7-cyano-7-deazaguanine synthase [Deltaproteobacteria bacterium]|nr:7-cyano-7-deazaguanine synthase [Deltaproteobacteria bacterium]